MNQVYCWGYNSQGSLGDGTTLNAHSPSQVQFPSLTGTLSNFSGEHFNCALLDNGTTLLGLTITIESKEVSQTTFQVWSRPHLLNITESGYHH